jgi:UDP-glucose 4-epimerase
MKSLVTGGAGFIGSNLVDELLSSGHEVVCIDNESSSSNSSFYWNKAAINYKIDICDYESIRPLFNNVDYVFHMAAECRIQSTIENPIKCVKTNVLGTASVLQAARASGAKRLVFSSTSSVYGNNPAPHKENQNVDCLNPYSSSKMSGEMICGNYTSLFGLQTVVLRYFNVYGNREPQTGSYAPVIGIFSRQKKNSEPLTVTGNGLQKRDFTNVLDVVKANMLAATKEISEEEMTRPFNIGSGKNHTVLEIAQKISSNIKFVPARQGEMKETLADITRARTVLGWNPEFDLINYLECL